MWIHNESGCFEWGMRKGEGFYFTGQQWFVLLIAKKQDAFRKRHLDGYLYKVQNVVN